MNITSYESLLEAAKQQSEPQRVLFVFMQTSLPEDAKDEETRRFHANQGGALQPIMCVDKPLDELSSFSDLVAESEKLGQDWKIVLLACLSGSNGAMPTADAAVQPLKTMVHTVQSGGDLSNYLAFDRNGTPVQFR